jgi:hypothetical protein
LRELSELNLDFRLEVTGFDRPLIEGAAATPEDDPRSI